MVDNRCSTNGDTASYGGIANHGLDLSDGFDVTARITAPKISPDGGAGVRSSLIRFTRVGATGLLSAYLDGAPWGHITDPGHHNVGPQVAVVLRNVHAPAYETSIDDLVVRSTSRS